MMRPPVIKLERINLLPPFELDLAQLGVAPGAGPASTEGAREMQYHSLLVKLPVGQCELEFAVDWHGLEIDDVDEVQLQSFPSRILVKVQTGAFLDDSIKAACLRLHSKFEAIVSALNQPS